MEVITGGLRKAGEEISKTLDPSQSQEDVGNKERVQNSVDTPLEKENISRDTSREDLQRGRENLKTTSPITSMASTTRNSQTTPTSMEKTETTPTKSTGKTQIDSLSREELITRVKKQNIYLQKMKARNEELTAECTKYKDELQAATPKDSEHILQQLQVLKTERDQALTESRRVKQIIVTMEQDEKENRELLEKQISMLKSSNVELEEKVSQGDVAMETQKEVFEREKVLMNDKLVAVSEQMKLSAEEKSSLMKEIDCLREESEQAKAKHEEELTRVREELNSQLTKVKSVTFELSQLKNERNEQQKAVEQEMLQNQEKLSEKMKEMKLLLEEKDERNKSLENEIGDIKEKIKLHEENKQKNDDRIMSLETQLASEQENKRKELDQINQQLLLVSSERERLEKEIKAVKLEHEQELKKIHEELENENKDRSKEQDSAKMQELLTSLQSERDELCQKLKDQETQHKEEVKKLTEEAKKFKAIAVKLKKEQSDSKSQPTELLEQLKNKDQSLEEMRTNLEKANNDLNNKELENEKIANQKLQDRIQELTTELNSTKEELTSSVTKVTSERDHYLQEIEDNNASFKSQLETIKAELLSSHSELSNSKQEHNDMASEIESLRESLSKVKEEHNETKQKLAAADKEAKSSSLMSLELEDYQRSMESLRGQIKDGQVARADLEKKLSSQQKQNDDLKTEFENYKEDASQKDDVIAKMKALLRKTTKDLSDTKALCTDKDQKIEESKRQVEHEKQNLETAKVEIAELTAKLQSSSEQFETSQKHYHQLTHSLEHKMLSLQNELRSTTQTLHQTQSDFENYKVRVHSVLKQKQSSTSVAELEDSLKQRHEVEVMKLKLQLKETQERLTTLLSEHEELEQEHQQLTSDHDDSIRSNGQEVQQLKEQLQEISDSTSLKVQELENEVARLKLENNESVVAFKSQIHSMQNKHQSQIDNYRQQLKQAHNDISRLQHDTDAIVLNKGSIKGSNPNESIKTTIRTTENKSIPTEERSSGEGMDCEVMATPSYQSKDEMMSFERLLSTTSLSSTDQTDPSPQLPAVDNETRQQLYTSIKRITHLTELLHESEANSVRLSDQTKLLKEEIRRLERNQQRQQEAAANMEYLKNIVLKFLHSTNDERVNLIPVICKLLQLSQQEKVFLQETVKGKNPDLPDTTGAHSDTQNSVSKGLVNYLHRWTGY